MASRRTTPTHMTPACGDPRLWRGKNLLGQAYSIVRDFHRHNTDGSVYRPRPPLPQYGWLETLLLFSSILHSDIEGIRLTPCHCRVFEFRHALAPVLLRSFRPMLLTRKLNAAPTCWLSPIAPRPRLEPRRRHDYARQRLFYTKIAIHRGTTTSTAFGCVALLRTGSPQTSIRRGSPTLH